MITTINVTAEDIREGQKHRCNTKRCAVALALQRKFPDAKVSWCVTTGTVNDEELIALQPMAISEFIYLHDSVKNLTPEPITFRVRHNRLGTFA